MRIFQVDAFTSTRFTGNPALVVLDADVLLGLRPPRHHGRDVAQLAALQGAVVSEKAA